MSLNIKEGIIDIDLAAIYISANDTDGTLTNGEYFEHYVVPKFKEIFGTVKYTTIKHSSYGEMPVIVLPDYLGNINETGVYGALIFCVDCVKLTKTQCYGDLWFGIVDLKTKNYSATSMHGSNMYITNSSPNYYAYATCTYCKGYLYLCIELDDNLGYHIGVTYISGSNLLDITYLSRDYMISYLTLIKTGEKIPAAFALPFYNESILRYGYSVNDNPQIVSISKWDLPKMVSVANMYEFTDGLITSDIYYICFPNSHVILQNFLLLGDKPQFSIWSTNLVSIGDSNFKLRLTGGPWNSGSKNLTIAKKVE